MSLEYRRGGRKISQKAFFDDILNDGVEKVMAGYAESLHEKAASVVDPETGKHATVFVRRIGKDGWSIHTSGSSAFARALEERLGLNLGQVHQMNEPVTRQRKVYLAHASEDKPTVLPLAEGLMKRGIEVWYDNWEIGYGDSLRRKMEQGLSDCTHFVVLLTPTSIKKPWVNEEIDVGLMQVVEGTAKFIGLRHNLALSDVSTFMKTRLTPAFQVGEAGIDLLAAEIFDVSKKPPLGEKPKYVQSNGAGETWSSAARVVAEYFVRSSSYARPMDPEVSYEDIQQATGLPMPDVRIGVLDLIGAGLLEKQDYMGGDSSIWPKADLFAAFDARFMGWDPEADGKSLAVHLLNLNTDIVNSTPVAQELGWQPRRFNAAAAYLTTARIVKPIETMGGDHFWPHAFMVGDNLLRFVRAL